MNGKPYSVRSDVVPRLQWNANSGYCGETSFICAGLNFGQYCSQWTARALASALPQYEGKSQLLLGMGNDTSAAIAMGLKASEFNNDSADTLQFIVWVKSRLTQGHVPIIGVYNNVTLLGEPASSADPQYDHIVPVVGWDSDLPIIDDSCVHYDPGDFITFSDNGLYGLPPQYPYLYRYQVGAFQGDRAAANAPDGPIYMLSNTTPNCGIAIEGVLDDDGFCLPVRMSCGTNGEPNPPMMPNSPPPSSSQSALCDQPPPPWGPIRLVVTVDLRGQTGPCNLYRYDDFAKVPAQNFNSRDAVQRWSIPAGSGPRFVVEYEAMSDETVVFRAVPASAP